MSTTTFPTTTTTNNNNNNTDEKSKKALTQNPKKQKKDLVQTKKKNNNNKNNNQQRGGGATTAHAKPVPAKKATAWKRQKRRQQTAQHMDSLAVALGNRLALEHVSKRQLKKKMRRQRQEQRHAAPLTFAPPTFRLVDASRTAISSSSNTMTTLVFAPPRFDYFPNHGGASTTTATPHIIMDSS